MKIIQICGTNGSGKTTLAKNLLASEDFERCSLDVEGKAREYWKAGGTILLGKYNHANCCGVDAGNYSVDIILKTIRAVIDQQKPKNLIFEDIRFGCSGTFKSKLLNLAQDCGYTYAILNLYAEPSITCNRVFNRSGNFNADYDSMISKSKSAIRSSRKAKALGAELHICNTGENDQQKTLSALKCILDQ